MATTEQPMSMALSEFLSSSGLPGSVCDYAERLEQVAVMGYQLADQIQHFVSVAGSGNSAELVRQALDSFNEAWVELASKPEQPLAP